MIQRIQSIFLLGVIIFMALSLSFNLWEYQSEQKEVFLTGLSLSVKSDGNTELIGKYELSAIAFASMSVALFSIFSFKKRKLQMLLGLVNNFLITAFVALIAFKEIPDAEAFAGGAGNYGISFFMPVAAILMNILANRFIQKDENLVKSMDRIR